ncbi:hypothetical protein SSX86_009883 [Deinandra increscens subsp. villosa]|uniref:Uncharacterized protein n=1 Tax=Deinandra increscens subsp. villosa TaxID=3103831 RepID=A0AAP0DE57_9ASTR
MGYNSTKDFLNLVDGLSDEYQLADDKVNSLMGYVKSIYRSEVENGYSAPMLWIGMYIALASLVCIIAMVADLLHGLRRRKLWFPCKYFRINAAFLSVIAVAMKLPVDLSGNMPGDVDQVGKLGSMAFMCTMMANLLPCLATMDNDALLSNVTALFILVITLVVNVCIQIQTVLLILHVSSCLAILKSKRIIEKKYQQGHERASKDIQSSKAGELLTFEQLKHHVSNHWIMAGSGSPQFITACFRTTSASGVICVLVTILHTLTLSWTVKAIITKDCDSDYSWSMIVILIVQSIGVVIGKIAPLSRCFATLSFNIMYSEIISDHFKVFKVESYWTHKLYDWKRASIRLPFRSHKLKVVIETLKKLILMFCIEFQEGVLVVCKIVALIPFILMICALYFYHCLKWSIFSSSSNKTEEPDPNKERSRPYVLHLEDGMELAERTLEGLLKSVEQLIQDGKRKQPINLKNLINGNPTGGFRGVEKLVHTHHHVPSLLSKAQYQDSWSLPVVTLTTIAVSLPEIEKNEVESLLGSVREGLVYVTSVEECLNDTNDYKSIRKAAESLWTEVDVSHKWLGHKLQDPIDVSHKCLGNKLQDPVFKNKKAGQILEWFWDKAKTIAKTIDQEDGSNGDINDDSKHKSICVNSMYRITKTIFLTYNENIENASPKELFDDISSMIADILAACLTNIPQVIVMKCHTSAIEKREASVSDAARLLGETAKIIETIQKHGIPQVSPDDLPFIDKWGAYLGNP